MAEGGHNPLPMVYAACVAVGVLFFCYEFKWQMWGTRLQLSLFVLACPVGSRLLSLRPRIGSSPRPR